MKMIGRAVFHPFSSCFCFVASKDSTDYKTVNPSYSSPVGQRAVPEAEVQRGSPNDFLSPKLYTVHENLLRYNIILILVRPPRCQMNQISEIWCRNKTEFYKFRMIPEIWLSGGS